MKGVDDGPDGLNDAVFDRALGANRSRRTKAIRPIRVTTTVHGSYAVLFERHSGHRATHPITGADLGDAFDRLTRVTEGGRTWWHIGLGCGSDGVAYCGGTLYRTLTAALASWGSR